MRLSNRYCLLTLVACLPGVAVASPVGDTFDLGWQGFFNDAIGQWTWGANEGPVGADFSSAGGPIGNFTFGTTGSFSFMGNTINVDSEVIDTGPTSETWVITVAAADGGPIFDPVDGLAENGGFWRAWHLRELAVGGFATEVDDGAGGTVFVWDRGDMIESPTFVDFASPVGIAAWSSESSLTSYTSGDAPAESGQTTRLSFGDLDFDGLVNEVDLDIWTNNYGLTGVEAFQEGDANGDTVVDAADYTHVRDFQGTNTRLLVDGETSLFARQEIPFGEDTTIPGVVLNRQYDNPGLIVYDDGIFQERNPAVSGITFSIDVTTTGPPTTAVPEPASAFLLALAGTIGLVGRGRR